MFFQKLENMNLLPTPNMSVGVGRMFETVRLFVWSITQKQMSPKCSNLV